jgi:hypothetical protein
VIQGIGLALAPIALYFSGLLRLLWNAIVAPWHLGIQDHLLPSGVVWLVIARPVHSALGGGSELLARRSSAAKSKEVGTQSTANALPSKKSAAKAGRTQPPIDEEMVRNRGAPQVPGIE